MGRGVAPDDEYIPTVTRMDDGNFKPLLRHCLRNLSPTNPTACDHVSEWDVSRVTNCSGLFLEPLYDFERDWIVMEGAEYFNVDISRWNTSSCNTMKSMFAGASSFNQDLRLFNTEKVTDMSHMFQNAHAFDQDLRHFHTERVTDMSHMFRYASEFTGRGLKSWNVSRVQSFDAMFNYASSFEGEGIGQWNVRQAKDLSFMFDGASVFNQDISGWRFREDADLKYIFRNAKSFSQTLCWDLTSAQLLDLQLDLMVEGSESKVILDPDCRNHKGEHRMGWMIAGGVLVVGWFLFSFLKLKQLRHSRPTRKVSATTLADWEEEEIEFEESSSTQSENFDDDEAGDISFVQHNEPPSSAKQLFPLLEDPFSDDSEEMESLTNAASDLAAIVARIPKHQELEHAWA